ncbi:MAG TPA: transcription termination/antitermination NusG family protein [Chloroflexia bacterium]|nr:transcription termination/antitermination NusG family protein [Chloroflexia bacterium]
MPVEQRSWYAIKTYSGYENKVKRNMEYRKAALNAGDRIFRIEMPSVEAASVAWKDQFLKGRNVYGYVLVETLADDVSLGIVRNTLGVLDVEKLEI